jgi:hypothetical protein
LSENEFPVEKIIHHCGDFEQFLHDYDISTAAELKKNFEHLKFLIRWKDYDSTEDSWLCYDAIKHLDALRDYCQQYKEQHTIIQA